MNIETATSAQREAIETDADRVLVVAGPGSGKTATTVARIHRLINSGTPPDQIAAITFTNAAARELEHRLCNSELKKGEEESTILTKGLGFIGTLHAFCLRMLKENGAGFGYGDGVAVISTEAAADLLESKARTLSCKEPVVKLVALKGLGRKADPKTLPDIVIASYFDDLRRAGVVDYDAILHEFIRMLTNEEAEGLAVQDKIARRFSHLFVDEVQDSAVPDWEIYRQLPIANKFYVGDPDQAVYSFRGGRVLEMLSESNNPAVTLIRLEENFRSRDEICRGAQRLIEHNLNRIAKTTVSVKGPGGTINIMDPAQNEGHEIGFVTNEIARLVATTKDIAILCRTNHVAEAYRKTLEACSLPVVKRERVDLPRDWRLSRAFLDLLVNPDNDTLAFFYLVQMYERKGVPPKDARSAAHAARKAAASGGRTLNDASIGLPKITSPVLAMQALASMDVSRESKLIAQEKFRDLPAGATMAEFSLSLGEVTEYVKEDKEAQGIRVMTIHGAKGREFDVVFLVGFEDESIPGRAAANPQDLEEERRLAYVAVTRARDSLYIAHATSRVTPWKEVVTRTPSRFVKEILP